MTDNSSYLNYLPPTLWSRDRDSQQFLGRMLRIFEKILTGININARIVRSEASIVNADGTLIEVTDAAEAAQFRAGDMVTVIGTTERVQINEIRGANIFLSSALSGTHASGTVRIDDLIAGQTVFRVDDAEGLGPEVIIAINQGSQWEQAAIAQVMDDFVTLKTGVTLNYPLSSAAVPVIITDGVTIQKDNHVYGSLEPTIDKLDHLFNPWRTRPDFLPWLASWLSLTLPRDWDEYQRRKITSEIVAVYQLRGFKKGLHTFLDIFAVTEARPRITIDDGDAVFRIALQEGVAETVHAVASGPPLLHPIAMAIDAGGNYIVADQGDEGLSPPAGSGPIAASLWRLSATGGLEFTSDPLPALEPIHQGSPLFTPTGVVVESTGAFVVVETGPPVPPSSPAVSGIYRFAPPNFTPTVVIDNQPMTVPKLPAIYPVDLVRIADGHFAVLDRGARLPNPASPQIILFQEGAPPTMTMHPLSNVSEPTSFVRNNDGNFLIADAGLGPPAPGEPTGTLLPADVYLVDISSATPTETSLLGTLPPTRNPLVFPTALVLKDANHILVSDNGAKPPGRFARLAEPAGLFRIPLPPAAPRVDPVTQDRNFVRPSALALDATGAVIMLDQGESQDQTPTRSWRSLQNEFGVIVYFSEMRPIGVVEKKKLLTSISRIIDTEKPAHTNWTLKINRL